MDVTVFNPAPGDRTAEIQAALNNAGEIRFTPGVYLVAQLEVRSNTRIFIEPGAVLKKNPAVIEVICLHLYDVENVCVEGGGTVDGNKRERPRARSHCIGIEGGRRIILRDLRVINAPTSPLGGSYGDGVYLGAGPGFAPIENLLCENLWYDNCDRHCSQIVSLRNAEFRGCRFGNVTTGDPGSAVNIETDSPGPVVQNITFRDCVFESSQQGVTANNHLSSTWENINFVGCVFRHNRNEGFYGGGGGGPGWGMKFTDCAFVGNGTKIETPQQHGHGWYGYQTRGTTFQNCLFAANRTGHGVQMQDSTEFTLTECGLFGNEFGGAFVTGALPLAARIERCNIYDNGRAGYESAGCYVGGGGAENCGIALLGNRLGNASAIPRQKHGVHLDGTWARTAERAGNFFEGLTSDERLT